MLKPNGFLLGRPLPGLEGAGLLFFDDMVKSIVILNGK